MMADASDAEPQTNGVTNDNNEEIDDKSKLRPADIDADVREMERRKRVEMIMSSKMFREELERIIEAQMREGGTGGPSGLIQEIQDIIGSAGRGGVFRNTNCVIPINDIRGVDSMAYSKGEKVLRCKVAAVYRLMDLYGWSQGIYNHITARINHDEELFLTNPYGMLYHEITASSLMKVDMQGNLVEAGTTNFKVNAAGFMLHSAIHAFRPDIKCIVHVHTPAVLAISSVKCGLLPLCQEAVVIGDISQHTYVGGMADSDQREKLARNFGPINKVMFLSNHGAVCCGETVEEAFYNTFNTVLACETQLKLMPVGIDNLVVIPEEARKQIYDAAHRIESSSAEGDQQQQAITPGKRRWRVGDLEFEALMRMLDNAGFRTGYLYRQPLIRNEPPKPHYDVELPPAVSSLGFLLEEEALYRQGYRRSGKGQGDRTRWLNSPNVYQKVEILETGTADPKKITKWVDASTDEWVAENSPTHTSTPVKIDAALQFVPRNTNPKEFKKLQQQIKDNRRADKISAGPQSHILEGVSWEDAKKLQDGQIKQINDQVILVGAASKGIIQREFQHNAMVYKTPYAKNPFDNMTDADIEKYKKDVERKQRGESCDEDQSESEPVSGWLDSKGRRIRSPMSPLSPASETEEDSRDGGRQVLRIETKQVPKASKAEVVLSDDADIKDDDDDNDNEKTIIRANIREEVHAIYRTTLPAQQQKPLFGAFIRRSLSFRERILYRGENTMNGDDAHQSTLSEGSPTKDLSTEESPKKDKKKKKGLRTPSFLKKKQKKKEKVSESAA